MKTFSRRRAFIRALSVLPVLQTMLSAQPTNAGTNVVDGMLGGHGYFYPPVLLPDFGVTDQLGKHAQFRQVLRGRISLVQLIFTTCSNICPIQGATFSQLQNMIPVVQRSQVQLLSVTIDPLNDDPKALAAWLNPFAPIAMWKALQPDLNDIDLVRKLLNQNKNELNSHLSEVLLVDTSARLVWRSTELPSSEALADKLFALLKKR
ncbi:SCO family protein [Undibacterium sp. SXout11W]|uniref:SCO family protein n=1 Tax=Undibacterium sp. SXout11W TaxID=3413050 RepID=UPI003BF291EB